MNKRIKVMLSQSSIKSKWKNINNWESDRWNNLLMIVIDQKIKINKIPKKNLYKITYPFGNQKIISVCFYDDIERYIVLMFAQRCLYLGDHFKIISQYKNYSF